MLTRTLTSILPSRSLCHVFRSTPWQTTAAPRTTRFLHFRTLLHTEPLLKRLKYPADNPDAEPPTKSGQDFERKHAGAKTAIEGKAGAADATALLVRSYHEVQHLDLEQQRQRVAAIQPWRILGWLWSLEKTTWEEVLSRDFMDILCWHLEAEGKDDFVVEWLGLVNKTQYSPKDALVTDTDTAKWPGRILASHVKAKLYWHASPEPAIEALFAVMKHDNNIIWGLNAYVVLSMYLETPYSPVYTKEAFEQYIQFDVGTQQLPFSMSSVFLWHPTEPSADRYLQWWQANSDRTRWWRRETRASVVTWNIRAAYILQLQGRNGDASWLRNRAKALEQRAWDHRYQTTRECHFDPKLEKLRQGSPHARQIWAAAKEERIQVIVAKRKALPPASQTLNLATRP